MKSANFVIAIETDLDQVVELGKEFRNALAVRDLAQRYMDKSALFSVRDHEGKLQFIGEINNKRISQLKGPANIHNYTPAQLEEIHQILVVEGFVAP